MLEREIATYNSKLSELLANTGRFVLIKDETVDGIFDTYSDGLKAAYAKYPEGHFLLKRIAPTETVAFFTRDIPTCPVSP